MSLATSLESLRARWSSLPGREKNLVRLATVLILGLLLWQLSIAPSLRTLRTAGAQSQALSAQLQQMQSLQTQAQALQKQPALGADESVRALTAAAKQTLGTTAQLSVAGERATVTLKDASADALAEWLAQARLNARSVPLEARLVRASTSGSATWNGVLVMSLPAR